MKLRNNCNGSALSFTILALLVLSIMVGIVATIAQTNIKQASTQENGLQAYYAARSGIELAFGALWITDTGDEATGKTLLKALRDGEEYGTQAVDFGEAGIAEVAISYERSSKEEKVSIVSEGSYLDITRDVTLDVYFEVDDDTGKSILKDMIWSN